MPLIVRWPPKVESGQRIEATVQLVDLMETVLRLARLPVPELQDGRPLFRPADETPPLFASLKLDGRDQWSIRTHPWKLILNQKSDQSFLFDLSSDPGETRDLSAEHPEIVRELRGRIAKRIERETDRRRIVHRRVQPGEVSEDDLSEDAREALRSLGYIQ